MESLVALGGGLANALTPANLAFALIGCILGMLVGVLPGVGPTAGIAVLIPLTFSLDATGAIIMLAAIYYGAMYGGTITSVLLNTPGEAASVVTCLDGYEMARQGRGGVALGVAAIGSFIGGTVATFGLVLVAPPLAAFALTFGPAEQFALLVLGLSTLIGLTGRSVVAGLMMGFIGLILGLIGIDPVVGAPRLTFGIVDLFDGIEFVSVVMGLFGISEILLNLEQPALKIFETKVTSLFPKREEWGRVAGAVARGTGLGFFLGLIPGTNSAIASFLSYVVERRFTKQPLGTGAIEGVAAPETSNNAYTSAALIPLFTLGLPSSPAIAVLLGAFIINGLVPGPLLFRDNPDFVWTVIASLYIGNFILLILNLPLVGMWVSVLKIRYSILMVMILVFAIVGSYSLNGSMFDVGMMFAFGLLGYIFKKVDLPMAPLVLALVLGPLIERSLRTSLEISGGSPAIFYTSPIALTLLVLAAIVLLGASLRLLPFQRGQLEEAEV
ncbi:MAG: tripartite tricarboxylate transporter permease [Chloroflexota bacterium]|nr:tripartite tricarboxylate transporter permease [Chloroflexota bacterium]